MSTSTLSTSQIEALWEQAGGSAATAPMAVAIARAESGGRVDATHANNDGSIDRGVWQINSVHGKQSTLDPLLNAKAAVQISHNGLDWTAWTTYTSGAYRQYLSGRPAATRSSTPAAASTPSKSPTTSSSGGLLSTDHVSGLKYAAVWTIVIIAGLAITGAGLNHALGGAPARAARTGAKTAVKVAAA